MELKFEKLARTFCYDCENNSFIKCNHCFDIYKEKPKMTDKIEINVKVNGKNVSLYEVSEQTLLTIRENSKPKPVPAFQVCDFSCGKRLIFRVTENIANAVGKYVALDSEGNIASSRKPEQKWLSGYYNFRELKLEDL